MQTRFVVLHKAGVNVQSIASPLAGLDVQLKEVQEFRQEMGNMEEIKRALDRANVRPYGEFRGKVNSIPEILKAS